jgi:hypothetical protein
MLHAYVGLVNHKPNSRLAVDDDVSVESVEGGASPPPLLPVSSRAGSALGNGEGGRSDCRVGWRQ